MDIETQVAVQFLVSFITDKVTDIEREKFSDALLRLLAEKFRNHWYPEKPSKGSAYRCVSIEKTFDVVLTKAAKEASIDADILENNLPDRMDLWIDPSEVSYRIGEHGIVSVIYKEGDDIVNSTSQHLADVLKKLPTITTAARASPSGHKSSNDAGKSTSPVPAHRKPENRLSPTARSFVTQQRAGIGGVNPAAAANLLMSAAGMGGHRGNQAAFLSQVQQLVNNEYLRKVYWPLLAATNYDPMMAQAAQNYLLAQELAKYQAQQMALQSHYMKMQQHKQHPQSAAVNQPSAFAKTPSNVNVTPTTPNATPNGILKVVT